MNDGDFIKIDFVGRVKDTGEIFDLTKEEIAKKENVYDPKRRYEPVLVIIGKDMVIPGVEKQLKVMKIGEERQFDVPKEEAFGNRDFKKIQIVSYSKFKKDKIEPVPGMFVDIDGKEAKIQTVSGGRVRVDFNHPLAGRTLTYSMKIVEEIKDPTKKALELVKKYGMNVIVKDAKVDDEGKLILVIEKDVPSSVKDIIKCQMEKYIEEVKSIEFELKPPDKQKT